MKNMEYKAFIVGSIFIF